MSHQFSNEEYVHKRAMKMGTSLIDDKANVKNQGN